MTIECRLLAFFWGVIPLMIMFLVYLQSIEAYLDEKKIFLVHDCSLPFVKNEFTNTTIFNGCEGLNHTEPDKNMKLENYLEHIWSREEPGQRICVSSFDDIILMREFVKITGGKHCIHVEPLQRVRYILNDKINFIEFMKNDSRLSTAIPRSYKSIEEVEYPVVVKTEVVNHLAGGIGVHIVHDPEKLKNLVANYPDSSYQLQQAILGKYQYTLYIMAYQGTMVEDEPDCIRKEFYHGLDVAKTGSLIRGAVKKKCSEFPLGEQAVHMARRLVKKIHYNGFGCFNYKEDLIKKKVFIWEFNPRVCGGLLSHISDGMMSRQLVLWYNAYLNDPSNTVNNTT